MHLVTKTLWRLAASVRASVATAASGRTTCRVWLSVCLSVCRVRATSTVRRASNYRQRREKFVAAACWRPCESPVLLLRRCCCGCCCCCCGQQQTRSDGEWELETKRTATTSQHAAAQLRCTAFRQCWRGVAQRTNALIISPSPIPYPISCNRPEICSQFI